MSNRGTNSAGYKYIKDLYLSPKNRAWLKRTYLNLELYAINTWPSLEKLAREDRQLVGEIAHLAALGKKQIEQAEEFVRFTTLTKRQFRHYIHPQKHTEIVIFSFYKPFEKRYKKNSWLAPFGLPTKATPRKQAYFYRNGISTRGFELQDQGQFDYHYLDLNLSVGTLRGKQKRRFYITNVLNSLDHRIWVSLALPCKP